MVTNKVLVIGRDKSLDIIGRVLKDADLGFCVCRDSAEGWDIVRTSPEITSLVISLPADRTDGCDLTRRIRQVRSHESLFILMIVPEDQPQATATAIEAGASDVLIDPFEAREFRMRMSIHPSARNRRIDAAHSDVPEDDRDVNRPTVTEASAAEAVTLVQTITPIFDPVSLRFTYGASTEQIAAWKNDEAVSKLALDQLLVCPCCGCLPSFRFGCGACGSSATKPDVLIHHYACAHVGAEAEFQEGHTVRCPKCRKAELVAGSDFEVVPGGHLCQECHSRISTPELIGHCLSCQHRFPVADAVIERLVEFRVSRVQQASTGVRKRLHTVKRRATLKQESGTV